ncbi:hypothetical protein [Pseudorhodoferax sp.]|uniref:hypothetical protein n=1 Tax=Pseudorhodoferax sp. TaxID=1993553 RepID=UPI002DD62DA8|nr:hypothetical protein [Pseudorhodoferax sp.]
MDKSLLQHLTDLVESTVDPWRRCLAQIDLGVSLAQMGRLEEADQLLDDLRSVTKDRSSERHDVMVGVVILGGVIDYYKNVNVQSLDRMRRAHALAQALGLKNQSTQASVWLMLFAYNFDNYSVLKTSGEATFAAFSDLSRSLQARACLVVADAAQLTGLFEDCVRWYSYARHFARDVHDHATIVAIENNRLSMGQARLRIERILGLSPQPLSLHRRWALEVESVKLLHYGLGASALEEILLWSQAQLHQMNGQFRDASSLVYEIRRRNAAQRCGTTNELLELEVLWCQAMAGDTVDVTACSVANLDVVERLSLDDQLVAAYFLKDIIRLTHCAIDDARLNAVMDRASNYCRQTLEATQEALIGIFPIVVDVRSGEIR